ncbi:vomeronasal type-1 receptor 4-like [Ochotona princeps]|uniref:vomeronasal type-1 receptor 4-like n=1 Tax=Ochotona princeps TaxID=9978 RepID=UPI0027147878|nr:vomeronasal type-1 receptor 4-like [Ochotona princeps]
MANSLLFLLYGYIFLGQHHLRKPIDLIFMNLSFVNILGITFRSLPEIMSFFRVNHFLNDTGCQAFLYLHRVTRGLSICTTSFLSGFQAITISPGHSKWAWPKSQYSKCILPFLLTLWVINMLVYIHIIETVRAKSNFTVVGRGYVNVYCEGRQLEEHMLILALYVFMMHDLVFMLLMIGSSLYMVFILYRHRRRARHIHSLTHSSESSAENKATRTILSTVLCFVLFYFANNFLTIYGIYASKEKITLGSISGMLSLCYPTFCPFLLMKNNKIIPKLTSSLSNMRIIFSPRAFSV